MGGDLQILNQRTISGEPVADLLVRHSSLNGTVIEGDLIPTLIDEIPILAVLASFAEGTTVIRNAEELKVKESDRLSIMVEGLLAMGAEVTGTDDGMIIRVGSRSAEPGLTATKITALPCLSQWQGWLQTA